VTVTGAVAQQFSMTAAGDDSAVFEKTDLVNPIEDFPGMGDKQGTFPSQIGKNGLGEAVSRLVVEPLGGLIENPDRRIFEQCPGQNQPPCLTAGEL